MLPIAIFITVVFWAVYIAMQAYKGKDWQKLISAPIAIIVTIVLVNFLSEKYALWISVVINGGFALVMLAYESLGAGQPAPPPEPLSPLQDPSLEGEFSGAGNYEMVNYISEPKRVNELYEKLYDAGCVQFGSFTLKSGIQSPIYIDFRGLVSKPALLKEGGKALADYATDIGCDRIAGLPYAGLPLAVAAGIAGNIPVVYPRREAKDYGTAKQIEGEFNAGEKVLVIDDIITDGQSKIEAIEPLKDSGLVVSDVLVIVDREQGGASKLEQSGYALHSIGKLSEIIAQLAEKGKIDEETRQSVDDFIANNQFK